MAPDKETLDAAVWATLRLHFDHLLELDQNQRLAYVKDLSNSDPELASMLVDLLRSEGSLFLKPGGWLHVTENGGSQPAFQAGEKVGDRYSIEELIGQGGAGQVFRAFDNSRQQKVALKVLLRNSGDASGIVALRNELNTASLVSHRNVCRLHDITIGTGAGELSFITMELLEGESLAARIRRNVLTPGEAYPIVIQLLNALEAAHDCGVIHRDLKPANIILVPDGKETRAVVTDFGLAKTIRADGGLSLANAAEIAGTPAYMAPEQLQGKRPTKAVDIHALGVILFEMTTGRLPFEGDTAISIAAARLNNRAPSPRIFKNELDKRWERTILACLDEDPNKRPPASGIIHLLNQPVPRVTPKRLLAFGVCAAALLSCLFLFPKIRPAAHNPAADTAIAKGNVFNERRTQEGINHAIEQYRRATELQPNSAGTWLKLADAYGSAANAQTMEPTQALAAAQHAAKKAISLDDKLARAHGAYAWTLSLDLDRWPEAEAEFRRATDLDRNDVDVRRWFGVYLRKLGRFREAEQQDRAGLDLTHSTDPRILGELEFLFFTSRQQKRFMAQVQEDVILFPTDSVIQEMLAKSYELKGQFAEALDTLKFAQKLGMNPVTVEALEGGVYAAQKDYSQATRVAADLEKKWESNPIDGILLAGLYGQIGDRDKAFQILEKAYQKRDSTLLSLATSPWMDNLRTDQRYRDWLKRLHFTDQIMQRMEFN